MARRAHRLEPKVLGVSYHLLIIDDDQQLVEMLVEYFRKHAWDLSYRLTASTGRTAIAQASYDALILDLMLPDGDGFDLCREIRAQSDIPILMLTAKGDEMDRIVGIELGADDYLPKPFNPRELLARLKAILRHSRPKTPEDVLRFRDIAIEPSARRVTVRGKVASLTSHQFELLYALAKRAGRVQSRESLMQAVRGENLEAFDRSIDVHVSRIRAAVEVDSSKPERILTVRGVGYVFARDSADSDGAEV